MEVLQRDVESAPTRRDDDGSGNGVVSRGRRELGRADDTVGDDNVGRTDKAARPTSLTDAPNLPVGGSSCVPVRLPRRIVPLCKHSA